MGHGELTPPGDLLAPVNVIVVEFPDGDVTASGFDRLLDLVDRNVIRVLDVEFVAKDSDEVRVVEVSELADRVGVDLSEWSGSSSGLLDADDIAIVADQIATGSIAVIVIFENTWVLDLVAGWAQARLVFDGGISGTDLVAALDATEPN